MHEGDDMREGTTCTTCTRKDDMQHSIEQYDSG